MSITFRRWQAICFIPTKDAVACFYVSPIGGSVFFLRHAVKAFSSLKIKLVGNFVLDAAIVAVNAFMLWLAEYVAKVAFEFFH